VSLDGEHAIASSIDRLTKAMESIATAMNPEPVKPMDVFVGTRDCCERCNEWKSHCTCGKYTDDLGAG